MKRQSVVIFPDTIPSEQVCIPLIQVFEPLVYCQPVENDQESQDMGFLCRDMVNHSFCKFVAPAPLGHDRVRFQHLISDIRIRKDDYAAQLGHLSIASIPTGLRPEKETKSSIVAGLLSSHGIREGRSERKEMLLWQARLVLKLAEQYDEDQYQLRSEMDKITGREKGLFSELRSESEQAYPLTEKLFAGSMEGVGQQRLRLKAWARIFSLGILGEDVPQCFVTTSAEALDHLAEENERRTGSRPSQCINLILPAYCSEKETFSSLHQQFQRDGADLLEKLASIINKRSQPSELERGLFGEEKSPWTNLLEQVFPVGDWGRCRLILYNFASVPARQLFLDAFGYDEDVVLQAEPVNNTEDSIIIGLLEPV